MNVNRQPQLQSLLKQMLGSNNVYYQRPPNTQLVYPLIVYEKPDIYTRKADNVTYNAQDRYEIILVSREPDHPVKYDLLDIPYCSYDRQYKSDNLYHDVFTLYF